MIAVSQVFGCGKTAVIASEAKQFRFPLSKQPDCYVVSLLAMTICPHAQPLVMQETKIFYDRCHCERSEAISIFFLQTARLLRRSAPRNDKLRPFFTPGNITVFFKVLRTDPAIRDSSRG